MVEDSESLAARVLDALPAPDHSTRRIYGYRLKLADLEDRIKVGQTERAVKTRVSEQVKTAGLSDVVEIIFDQPAVTAMEKTFTDTDVHNVLRENQAVEHLKGVGGSEWFKCTIDDLKNAYASVVTGKTISVGRSQTFKPRDEQKRAIAETQSYFEARWKDDADAVPRFLWNAKMRFGKTFAAYHLANNLEARRVLVVSFKTAVADAWETDLRTHVDFEGWEYRAGDLSEEEQAGDLPERLAYFNSFQGLFGKDPQTKEFKLKYKWVAETDWDLVIFDEFHYGAWRYADKELVAGEVGAGAAEHTANYSEDAAVFDEEFDEWGKTESEFLPFKRAKAFLYLSGTPFRALASGQFEPKQIFNWTYTDEQDAKARWVAKEPGDRNPYEILPEMQLLTYSLPEEVRAYAASSGRDEFDLNTFFAATGTGSAAEFIYKDHVNLWLRWMSGMGESAMSFAASAGMPVPYADTRILRNLNHAVWFLPSVAAVFAMENLLKDPMNKSAWGEYIPIAVAGSRTGNGADALPPVRNAIGAGHDSKTITLTCGKLLTGVTVSQWSSILMLCNLSSPETYFQAAFRVQSAWTLSNPNGNEPNEVRVVKPACLVIDFAPNRALRLYADYGVRLGDGKDPEQDLEDLVKFLPVLAFDGATMKRVSASQALDAALASASVDARRMESARFINPRYSIVGQLDESARRALAQIRPNGAGATRSSNSVEINKTHGLENKRGGPREQQPADIEQSDETVPLAEGETELAARLQFLAKRISAFMYLSSNLEKTLEQVLSTDEQALFEQVMQLSAHDMRALVTAGLFNESALRLAILEFSRAERTSLDTYANDLWARPDNA